MTIEIQPEPELPPKVPRLYGALRKMSAAISMLLGGALFFSATVWLANINTGSLSRSTDIAFVFGILSGIFQLGSTQILCLLGLKAKWKLFVWFTLASFIGSVVVLVTSIIVHYNPEASNAIDVQHEELAVIITSGLDCVFTAIFLIIHLFINIIPTCICGSCRSNRTSSVPYQTMT